MSSNVTPDVPVEPLDLEAVAKAPAPQESALQEPVPAEPAQEASAAPAVARCPWWRRFLFGTLFAYLVLYNLPFPLQHLPWLGKGDWFAWLGVAAQAWEKAMTHWTAWFGESVLGFAKVAGAGGGSGDKLFDYVQAAIFAAAAVRLGLAFSLADRRGRTIGALHALLRIHVRYVLAVTLLGYGFHKVFPLQFGVLDGMRLYGTYGNASPMNMLWTFLSASPAYTIFSGAMEVLGGILLFWRRTTTLGALVTIAVMTNVAMLNYCYDVPVKLYSTHLLAMAVLLAAGDARRLLALLLGNRATEPVVLRRPLPPWLRWPLLLAKVAFVGWLLWRSSHQQYEMWRTRGESPPPFAGLWEATEFSLVAADGTSAPPRTHWHHFAVMRYRPQDPTFVSLGLLGYEKKMGRLTVDAEKHTLRIEFMGRPAPPPLEFAYEERTVEATADKPAAPQLVLTGQVEGGTFRAVLQKREPETFPIHSRGFHWIQEFPVNSNR